MQQLPWSEREIINLVIEEALSNNIMIAVYGEGELDCDFTLNDEMIRESVGLTDETMLDLKGVGRVLLIHGNGADVISDYSFSEQMEGILWPANVRAEEIAS